MPSSLTDAEVLDYFTNYSSLYLLPYDDPIRQGAIKAFGYVTYPLFVSTLVLQIIPLVCGFFQTNYYLGDNQNAIEGLNGRDPTDPTKEKTDEIQKVLRVNYYIYSSNRINTPVCRVCL